MDLMTSRTPALLLLLALTACVSQPGPGPDLGDCADVPEGIYSFGELGIGTCLAGPVDLRFYQRDGRTWLGVTNANPFRLFTTGSLLSIGVDDLDLDQPVHDISKLEAYALPLESYTGRLGVDASRGLAVVPSRLSADTYTTTSTDQAWLINLQDPTAPAFVQDKRFITVRADPYEVVIDERNDRAFVLNATSYSISVIDLGSSPPTLLDPAPASLITGITYDDADGSGSTFELLGDVIVTTSQQHIVTTDQWTGTWIEGTTRLWAETPLGLQRWTGSGSSYAASGFGAELGLDLSETLTHVSDPWISSGTSNLIAHFADAGMILTTETDGSAGGWGVSGISAALIGGEDWNASLGGPSVVTVDGRVLMYFDGRTEPGAAGSIGVATTADSVSFNAQAEPLLTPDGTLTDLAHPSVLVDVFTGNVRMWLGAVRDGRWTIALSESPDGVTAWSSPEVVLELPGEHAGAPFVAWVGGRYEMWLAVSEGGAWHHAHAWSWDGETWSDPELLFAPEIDFDPTRPPRAGVQIDSSLAWRVEGANTGLLNAPLISGSEAAFSSQGFSLRAAAGHEVGTTVAGLRSAGGVIPGSVLDVDGWKTLYVTLIDEDGRGSLAALRPLGDTWGTAAANLIPTNSGGNVAGASAPVVYEHDGAYHMLYAAERAGLTTIRHAVSEDGLSFTPTDGGALTSLPALAVQAAIPGSVEQLTDGTLRLWFAGTDGGAFRVSAADSTDGVRFTPVTLGSSAAHLSEGEPGTFDDSGVRDPMVVLDGDKRRMWYSGFDGSIWAIGTATQEADGSWTRRIADLAEVPTAVLSPVSRTFAAISVHRPVAEPVPGGWRLWHAGDDGFNERIGQAFATEDRVFPTWRFPTPGDTLGFVTRRGETGRSEIRLDQTVDGVRLPSPAGDNGPTAALFDEARGLLFAVAQSSGLILAIDVRDDSTATWDDLNYLDIEAVLRVRTTTGLIGFNDLVLAADNRLYLASQEPDAIVIIDTSVLVDDDVKQVYDTPALAALTMHDLTDDADNASAGQLGAAGLALVPSQDLLIVTHFRDNSVSIFDLSVGAHGEEIRYIEHIGENPHVVRVSPDERYAVIGVNQGDVYDSVASSQLAILDLDQTSPTYLSVISRIVNR
jgi:predicted GH43/DUF377 family glycosyl hydrolase